MLAVYQQQYSNTNQRRAIYIFYWWSKSENEKKTPYLTTVSITIVHQGYIQPLLDG